MKSVNINDLAKQFIEGEWFYSTSEKILKKIFADSNQLRELNLIDEEGYLDETLKSAMISALSETVLANAVGPFGDEDIFSGEIFEDVTQYNIELHQITELTMDALQKLPNVSIKIVD